MIQANAGRGMYVQGENAAVYVKTIESPQVQPAARSTSPAFPPTLQSPVFRT